jgi:hypothetical protein
LRCRNARNIGRRPGRAAAEFGAAFSMKRVAEDAAMTKVEILFLADHKSVGKTSRLT